MSPVTIVGMAVGTLLVVTAIAVFWSKKEFPVGGLGAAVIGLILIGMSQWSNVNFKFGDISLQLEALQQRLDSTAVTAAALGDEARNTAAAVEMTRQQIGTLTVQLAARNYVTPQAAAAIRSALATAPRPDTTRLRLETDKLRSLTKFPIRPRPVSHVVPPHP